jgi:hypothetical protein
MAAARSVAGLEAFSWGGGGEGFETARCGMEVGE